MMYGRRPLTRLEAGLYASVLGIFITIFAYYMLGYMEVAERVAMQATLINTTSAINIRMTQATLLQGRPPADWSRSNPFELAGMSPPNFAGDSSALQPGQWAFDGTRAELVYLPRLRLTLHTPDGAPTLRFRLVRGLHGYALEPRASYTWG